MDGDDDSERTDHHPGDVVCKRGKSEREREREREREKKRERERKRERGRINQDCGELSRKSVLTQVSALTPFFFRDTPSVGSEKGGGRVVVTKESDVDEGDEEDGGGSQSD